MDFVIDKARALGGDQLRILVVTYFDTYYILYIYTYLEMCNIKLIFEHSDIIQTDESLQLQSYATSRRCFS